MTAFGLAVLTVTLLAFAFPTGAVKHDSGCRPPGAGGTDAPATWPLAGRMAALVCTAEMLAPNNPFGQTADDSDWFYTNFAATKATATVTVRTCFAFAFGTLPPLDSNLEVFFLPGAAPVPDAVLSLLDPTLSAQKPGTLVGSSAVPGQACDQVGPASLTGTANGRLYIHDIRAAGSGALTVTVTII